MLAQVTYDNDHDGTLIMNGTELYNEMNNSNHFYLDSVIFFITTDPFQTQSPEGH